MKGWLATVAAMLAVYALLPVLVAALRGDLRDWRSYRTVARVVRRLRGRPGGDADVVPLRRPVEQVSADLRRIHAAFHGGGMRFAKYEGCRQAYDRVLAEAADMMGTSHLLSLLPPGDELDRERVRVEMLLRDHGLLPPLWAA
jgi:hypothetical protein